MSEARDAVLRAVRARLGPHARHGDAMPPVPARSGVESSDELARTFRERVAAVGGRVVAVDSDAGAADAIAEVARSSGARSIAWSDAGVLASLRAHGSAAGLREVDPRDRVMLLGCDLGVTTAQWGVASTGTLVLDGSAERHRLVSLLPPVHVCVLSRQALLPDIAAALARIAPDGAPGPLVTFVTGPSRTADIELTLVVGVHGPRELHVVLVP